MIRIAITAAWSRKRRLAATVLAVLLGVTFLAATLVVGDSARAGFETAFGDANAGTDALVRGSTRFTNEDGASTSPIDGSVVDVVRAVEGVEAVAPTVEGSAQILGRDGSPLGGDGPPTLGTAWIDDPDLTGFEIAEGRAPEAPGEVVIDRASADDGELAVGDQVTILTPAPVDATVVGVATFGDEDSLGGATLAAFSLEHAQKLLLGTTSSITGVVVSAVDGLDQDGLVTQLEPVLPDGAEAITGAALTAEQQDDIEGDFLGFFETALLMFAAIALLVGAFSIFNTFSILAAQRTRESALLRTLGASRVQVLTSGVAEAIAVGVLGSALGLAAGVAVAQGLLSLMDAAGFGLPIDGLRVDTDTIVTSLAVGMVVTVVSGLLPAWRASRVAPLAALRDVAVDASASSRWRLVIGGVLGAAGVGLVLSGTSGDGNLPQAGMGAAAVLVGVVLIGPVLARPVGLALGAPLRLRGLTGDLARRNAVRNPRRTAATSAALLVGVGVVSLFTVFGASVGASIQDAVDESFGGDLVVEGDGFSGAGLSPALLDDVRALDEVGAATGLGWGTVAIDGDEREVTFAHAASLAEVADFDVVEGDIAAAGPSGLAISTKEADRRSWALGDDIEVQFADGGTEVLTVAAVYDDRALGGDVIVSAEAWEAHVNQTSYFAVLVGLADGIGLEDGRAAVTATTAAYGGPDVQDRDEFVESEAAEVDALLNIIYGLLGVAILIALMGIANTLSLSIHERTRELGLLRAVGQSRSQLRAMVRWESVVVSTFGAVTGVGLGVFLGWGLVRALGAAEGFGTFALPVGSLAVVVLLGAAVGVVAALRPAWRASKLDVLAAVTTE